MFLLQHTQLLYIAFYYVLTPNLLFYWSVVHFYNSPFAEIEIPAQASRDAIKIHACYKSKQAKIVMMSDLIKAQNTPQFNWYACWTSLGANGMPDKLIKEGLKQPNQIKISFKKNSKEITSHVAPNQAQFGMEYFLAYTLPDVKSKIFTRLSGTQKEGQWSIAI